MTNLAELPDVAQLTDEEVAQAQAEAGQKPEVVLNKALIAMHCEALEARVGKDEALVNYMDRFSFLYSHPAFARFVEEAVRAKDRLDKTREKPQKHKERSEAEWLAEAVKVFEAKGFGKAVIAMKTDLANADLETLDWVWETLDQAIPEARIYGPIKYWAYKFRNRANTLANDLAQKQQEDDDEEAEKSAATTFAWFLDNDIGVAEQNLIDVKDTPPHGHDQLLSMARKAYEKAVNTRFNAVALKAIERMGRKTDNVVSEFLKCDDEAAEAFNNAEDGRRAVTLLKFIEERVSQGIKALETKIANRRQQSHEKSAGQKMRQAERAKADEKAKRPKKK